MMTQHLKRWIAAFGVVLLIGSASLSAQTFSAQIQQFWNQLRTGALQFSTLHLAAGSYANWGATLQANGYGIRDNAGVIEFKDSGGSWSALVAAVTGGSCTSQVVRAIAASTGVPTCVTVTSAYVDTSIALTGTDINTTNQVTATHLAAALPATQGGTGFATLVVGDVLSASTTTAWSKIAAVATGSVFASAGTGTLPVWTTTPTVTALSLGTANLSTTGQLRLGVAGQLNWRNNANNADLTLLSLNASDQAQISTSLSMAGNSITGVSTYRLNGANTFVSSTAPTIASGGCTSPAISTSNGTAYFRITLGSACAAGILTLTMPAANNLWMCDAVENTAPASNVIVATSTSTTAVVLTNYARTTGIASNFTSGDILLVKCLGG